MLDTEDRPTGPVTPRRRSPGRWLLVAAAAAVVAVVGTLLVAAGGDDEDPVDTVTPPTTAAPAPAPAQDVNECFELAEAFPDLEPGLYFIDPDGDDTTPLRVTYQVAAEDWSAWFGAVKTTGPGATMLTITTLNNLVTDGCLDFTPLDPPVGPTVDDLATALSQLAPFEVTAPPTDVTLLGYPGKHLELTVPDLRVHRRPRSPVLGLRRRRAAQLDLTAQRQRGNFVLRVQRTRRDRGVLDPRRGGHAPRAREVGLPGHVGRGPRRAGRHLRLDPHRALTRQPTG